MTENKKETQNFVTTQTYLIDCLLEIIDSHAEENWGKLGIDVLIADNDDVYLNDFLEGEEHSDEGISGTINPMGRIDDLSNPRENLLVYFYVCVMAMENKAKYEKMRKEEDDKKARRYHDNEVGSSGRGRSENLDDAERPLPDSQPSA